MQIPKILILDDEVSHLEAIIDIIEDAGCNYEILSALSGKTALEITQKEMPNLIITDWEMPTMNGIEFIEQLKKNQTSIDIPVIMCTGIMTTSENLETALRVGAVDYIRKPVDKIELIARIKANLHLAEKYNEVKKLNEMKDKIFSVISHDLRGPVGMIKSFADLIIKGEFENNQGELIDIIKIISKQSSSIFNTLENLLSWARSHRNAIVFNPQKQALNNSIINSIQLLDEVASKKKIKIINQVYENHDASFDLNLISTLVRNLITNAIKFTHKNGQITIDAQENESHHIVSITDTGIGISPERMELIFDKASYETSFGTQSEKGSGLGIKLCQEFIEMHQGKIWVESELGKGSTFYFSIPK
jgi:two-component system sensor histidine kinase/response regulator